jgi:hypothetical protein
MMMLKSVVSCRVDYRLERQPAVIRRSVAGLNKLGCGVPAFGEAIGGDLSPPIGNRQITLRLASRRDAQIEHRLGDCACDRHVNGYGCCVGYGSTNC